MYLPPLPLTQSPLCLFPQNQYKTKPMSNLSHLFDLPNQICYVQCGFCTTILLVSVPCSSLSMVVTVRCGHCTSLLSVNMTKASFVPLHLLASLTNDNNQTAEEEACPKEVDHAWKAHSPSNGTNSDNEDDDITPVINHVVNKPPEKRQRAPSAYNTFIKEEIKRLKAGNPSMAHKEAFSTAAKNWAHFPPTQYKDDGESCSQNDPRFMYDSDVAEVHVERNGFQEQRLRGTQYGQEHSLSEQQIAIIRK